MTDAPRKGRERVALSGFALLLCVSVVLLATMWPAPIDQGFSGAINRFLDVLHRNGIPEWFGYNKLEFSANVLMFLPLGFLLTVILPARFWWLALIMCPALSISIELTQGALLAARFATVSDVIANSSGALIGILLAVMLRAFIYYRDQKLIAWALWQHGIRS
ncbi:MAG: VanZ family protein [Actinomycetales bacterium]|nr:VanZ family protein [Actinomycetales bacterium]